MVNSDTCDGEFLKFGQAGRGVGKRVEDGGGIGGEISIPSVVACADAGLPRCSIYLGVDTCGLSGLEV